MFLSRLNGEPIGFSVLGFFVIDKNTILMVINKPIICICFVNDLDLVIRTVAQYIQCVSKTWCRTFCNNFINC